MRHPDRDGQTLTSNRQSFGPFACQARPTAGAMRNRSTARAAIWSTTCIEAVGLQVERRHRRQDDRPHFGHGGHVAQMRKRQRGLARQQDQRAAFLQLHTGGAGQQIVVQPMGDGRQGCASNRARRSSRRPGTEPEAMLAPISPSVMHAGRPGRPALPCASAPHSASRVRSAADETTRSTSTPSRARWRAAASASAAPEAPETPKDDTGHASPSAAPADRRQRRHPRARSASPCPSRAWSRLPILLVASMPILPASPGSGEAKSR